MKIEKLKSGEPPNRREIVIQSYNMPTRRKPKIIVPETYPRISTLATLAGLAGLAGIVASAGSIKNGGDELNVGLCLLLPISAFFLYAGAAGLWDCYKVWRIYEDDKK
ncbi:MAG TPA: hypothetical protein HA224_00785 [Nanoarchaeota archaeon]|nr:hypothetical protein [Nanoarchaeota archaeon]